MTPGTRYRLLRALLTALLLMAGMMPVLAAAAGDETVRDEFNEVAYDGDDGSTNWDDDWEEQAVGADGPDAGWIQVVEEPECSSSGCLRIGGEGLNVITSVSRTVDLTDAELATLTYQVRRERLTDPVGSWVDARIRVEGGSWTTLATYQFDTTDSAMTVESFDVSAWTGETVTVQFRGIGWYTGYVYIDNVQVAFGESALPPVFSPVPQDRADEANVPVNYTVTATDPDGDDGELVFSATGLPNGLAIDRHLGVISGAPNDAAFTRSPFETTITVEDEDGYKTAVTFTWTITGPNRPPTIAPIANGAVNEGSRFTVTAVGDDEDLPADTLTYQLVTAPSGAAINSSTGKIIWDTVEADGPGTYPFTVKVKDADLASASTSFTVTVNEVNTAPQISAVADQVNGVGDTVELTVSASDGDVPANTLRFSAEGLPPGLLIGRSSGVISGLTTLPGSYDVTVTVRDDGSPEKSATVSFDWDVIVGNRAPVLDTIAQQSPNPAGVVTFTATADDANGDDLSFWLAAGDDPVPAGATIGAADGKFTWVPQTAHLGRTFSFVVGVSDDGVPSLSDQQAIVIVVPQPNRPPEVNSVADQRSAEGAVVQFPLAATDPDGDALTWSATGLPAGVTLSSAGVISGTVSFDAADASPYTVTITVTDNGVPRLKDSTTFTWTIDNTNRAPTVTGQAVTVVGSTPTLIVVAAEDPDGDPLAFSLVEPAQGTVTVDGNEYTYVAPAGFIGEDGFIVGVDDGEATATAAIRVTVRASNAEPVVADDAYETVTGTTLTIDAPGVLANDGDADGDLITATVVDPPDHGTVTMQPDGAFTYRSDEGFSGTDSFAYRVTDGVGEGTTGTVEITVTEPSVLPTVEEATTLTRTRDDALVFAVSRPQAEPASTSDADVADESMTRAVLAIARESFAAVPAMQFPILLLVVALLLGVTVGRVGLVPFGAKRHRGKGMVRSYDPAGGFGLIIPDEGGSDVFVHTAAVNGKDTLTPGDLVEYTVAETRGRPTAIKVWRLAFE